MSEAERRERLRVERAVEYIRRRLQLDAHFVYEKSSDGAFMGIDRANREDSRAFKVTFDPAVLADQSHGQIRCHAFHELIHAMSMPLYSLIDDKILMAVPIKNGRAGLRKQYWKEREDVVRHMERRFGPLCFPNLPWSKA